MDYIHQEIHETLATPAIRANRSIPHHQEKKMTAPAHITNAVHPRVALHYLPWLLQCRPTIRVMDLLQMDMRQIQDIAKNTENHLQVHTVTREDTQVVIMGGVSNQCPSPNLPQDKEQQ